MTPITASATQLPMKDKEFDVVLASDMLEHVPPDLRETVIGECLRVAQKARDLWISLRSTRMGIGPGSVSILPEAKLSPPSGSPNTWRRPSRTSTPFAHVDGLGPRAHRQ